MLSVIALALGITWRQIASLRSIQLVVRCRFAMSSGCKMVELRAVMSASCFKMSVSNLLSREDCSVIPALALAPNKGTMGRLR